MLIKSSMIKKLGNTYWALPKYAAIPKDEERFISLQESLIWGRTWIGHNTLLPIYDFVFGLRGHSKTTYFTIRNKHVYMFIVF